MKKDTQLNTTTRETLGKKLKKFLATGLAVGLMSTTLLGAGLTGAQELASAKTVSPSLDHVEQVLELDNRYTEGERAELMLFVSGILPKSTPMGDQRGKPMTRIEVAKVIYLDHMGEGYTKEDNPNLEKEAIKYVTERGIMLGHRDGSFGEQETVTRVQMAKILTTAFDLKKVEPSQHKGKDFTDIPRNYWGHTYVHALSKVGVTHGTSASRYSPHVGITAEQFMMMYHRAMQLNPTEVSADGKAFLQQFNAGTPLRPGISVHLMNTGQKTYYEVRNGRVVGNILNQAVNDRMTGDASIEGMELAKLVDGGHINVKVMPRELGVTEERANLVIDRDDTHGDWSTKYTIEVKVPGTYVNGKGLREDIDTILDEVLEDLSN